MGQYTLLEDVLAAVEPSVAVLLKLCKRKALIKRAGCGKEVMSVRPGHPSEVIAVRYTGVVHLDPAHIRVAKVAEASRSRKQEVWSQPHDPVVGDVMGSLVLLHHLIAGLYLRHLRKVPARVFRALMADRSDTSTLAAVQPRAGAVVCRMSVSEIYSDWLERCHCLAERIGRI
jgi:hypothetical protein|eukprot:4538647-Prymnesium_polylepis.2